MKNLIDSNTIIVGNFWSPLTSMDRSSKWKINKETVASNDSPDQMDWTDISEQFVLKQQNILLFQVHMNILQNRPHIKSQNRWPEMQKDWTNTMHLFFNNSAIKFAVSQEQKWKKQICGGQIKCYFILNGSTKKSKKKWKIHGNIWKWEHHCRKPLKCSKSDSKREEYTNTGLLEEARKISSYNLILSLRSTKEA